MFCVLNGGKGVVTWVDTLSKFINYTFKNDYFCIQITFNKVDLNHIWYLTSEQCQGQPANVKYNLLVKAENILVIILTNLQPKSDSKTQIQIHVYPLSQGYMDNFSSQKHP